MTKPTSDLMAWAGGGDVAAPTTPKQAVVGSAATPAATLYDVYAAVTPIVRAAAGLPAAGPLAPRGALAERSFVRFSKVGPDGAQGVVVTQWRTAEGKSDAGVPFEIAAAHIETFLDGVTFIDEPPPWPAEQATPPQTTSISPAQARAQGTGVGAFLRAYKWPLLGVGVLLVGGGAALYYTRKKR